MKSIFCCGCQLAIECPQNSAAPKVKNSVMIPKDSIEKNFLVEKSAARVVRGVRVPCLLQFQSRARPQRAQPGRVEEMVVRQGALDAAVSNAARMVHRYRAGRRMD